MEAREGVDRRPRLLVAEVGFNKARESGGCDEEDKTWASAMKADYRTDMILLYCLLSSRSSVRSHHHARGCIHIISGPASRLTAGTCTICNLT